jgi:hypothetical protein
VILAKTGHGPHSSTLVVVCVVRLLFVLFYILFVLCSSLYCLCVCMCTVLLPPGGYPTAVNKYISYHIIYVSVYSQGRIEVCTGCWWGSLRERGHWGDQYVDGRIILRRIFSKLDGVVGTGWSWLRIGTGGGHLWVR